MNKNNDNKFVDTQAVSKQLAKQKKITAIMMAIFVFLLVLLLVFVFVCSPAMIYGESMAPTLNNGEIIMVSKIHKVPKVGDIVVYNKPTENKKVIKRVVGVEGDVFKFSYSGGFNSGYIEKEGTKIMYTLSSEQFFALQSLNYAVKLSITEYTFTVPKGKVFTIGDNHNNSIDGRNYGPIDIDKIIGIKI